MYKVIVVEDEELIRRGIVFTTDWGKLDCIVAAEASNGQEGIEKIAEYKPDLVITDITMPVCNGLKMIEEVKKIGLKIEFIVLTGYDEFEYAKKAISLGVSEYLLKPIDDNEFYLAVEKVTNKIKDRNIHNKMAEVISKINENFHLDINKQVDRKLINNIHVNKIIDKINSDYDKELTIYNVAESLEISESYLSRIFKKYTSKTFIEYLTNFRIQKAVEMLENPDYKVYQIANCVGFNDVKYFNTVFRKIVGYRPTEFRAVILQRKNNRLNKSEEENH